MAKAFQPVVRIVAAGVLLLGARSLHAQAVQATVDPVAVQSGIAANPDFDIAGLWKALKIPSDLDTVYAKVSAAPPPSARVPFDRCANVCRAELSRANIDDDLSEETVLAVYQESKACRFLVFKSSAGPTGVVQWRFLGYADHDALGQYEPEYRVAFMGNRRYLVVSAPGQHGTGMWLRYERWYEVSTGGLREVLSLPAEGLECRDGRSLCRAFGSTVVASRVGTRGEEIVVSFTARYWGDAFLLDETRQEEIPLFGRSQRAVYGRPLKSTARYELAPLDSEIASWEVDSAFGIETLTCQDFFGSNEESLRSLATGPASPARAWLARYADRCSPSTQRSSLLELIGK